MLIDIIYLQKIQGIDGSTRMQQENSVLGKAVGQTTQIFRNFQGKKKRSGVPID